METIDPKYLLPTAIIDSDHPRVVDYAGEAARGGGDPVKVAVKLYDAVRDDIRYDPYSPFHLPEHYKASTILEKGRGYCVAKASLLCALGRACGIPARIGFATVRNHLATRQLIEYLGSDLFVYHGFTEFYLNGRWIKATPAFNRELCRRHHVPPLAFDGKEDSVFQPFNLQKERFMEYVDDHGTYADVPVDTIVSAWEKEYGKKRVRGWIAAFEASGGTSTRDFAKEEVIDEPSHLT
ncbi:MAG: transglutaminase domain-containing protein [Desulfobacteraceae bacterium]|nr:MAG: transglutaminase domain-containing protein [Desulfobacteraceae bacterium]